MPTFADYEVPKESTPVTFNVDEVVAKIEKKENVSGSAAMKQLTGEQTYDFLINTYGETKVKDELLPKLTGKGNTRLTTLGQLREALIKTYGSSANVSTWSPEPEPGVLRNNDQLFNLYNLLDPVVLKTITEDRLRQIERQRLSRSTVLSIVNGSFGPGALAATVQFKQAGGGNLDPNMPIEMRGRGKLFFHGGAPEFGLWKTVRDGKMSEQFKNALSRVESRLSTETKAAFNDQISALDAAEKKAEVTKDRLKSLAQGLRQGAFDNNALKDITNPEEVEALADEYNATLSKIASKTSKLSNAFNQIIISLRQ